MSKIEIKKGKLLKGDIIQVEYLKSDGTDAKPAECSEKHLHPPHEDLKKAFVSLSVHAALTGEFISSSLIGDIKKPDTELVENFNVTGFTIVGEDEDEGVILSARKTLKTGKTMGFNTPKILLEDESETAYQFAKDLALCIADCKDQLTEYLNGKFAPDPQGTLFLDENKNVVHGEKKLPKRKQVQAEAELA